MLEMVKCQCRKCSHARCEIRGNRGGEHLPLLVPRLPRPSAASVKKVHGTSPNFDFKQGILLTIDAPLPNDSDLPAIALQPQLPTSSSPNLQSISPSSSPPP